MENDSALQSRLAALLVLEKIACQHLPLEEAWQTVPQAMGLHGRDREFAWLLVMTVLRHKLALEQRYQRYLQRPLPAKQARAGLCLSLGAGQLLVLGTPPHAAVSTSVDLARAAGLENHAGLVNAVLKKVAASLQEPLKPLFPDWLQDAWQHAYGEEVVSRLGMMLTREPPLDLSVKSDAEGWARKLEGTLLPTGTVRLAGGNVTQLPGFAEGEWWVQDMAAALPAMLLGDVRGKQVFDLCAAPGGKTAQLAARGAVVTAVEKSPARSRRLQENLTRLKLEAKLVVSDLRDWKPELRPDAILLDAPCSATGTFRKHPDVLWLRQQEDISRLAELQQKLLKRAARWLKPGGVLVYCVCSLQPEEGEKQRDAFLAQHPDFRVLSVQPAEIGGLGELITANGELRTLPIHQEEAGGMDGFYAVRFVKDEAA